MGGPFPNLVPLGKFTITVGGLIQLSLNCGPQGQQLPATTGIPAKSGRAFRGFVVMADLANTGNIYILPAGKTLAANPSLIIAAIPKGTAIPVPWGVSDSSGYLPENFCFDTDTGNNLAYGYGIVG